MSSVLGAEPKSPSGSRFFHSARQEPRKFTWSFLVQAVAASSAVLHVSRVRRQINGTWSDALKRTYRNLEAKNEIFYGRMVRLADRILKTDNGPLLPDHDQLKYPPGLPTLVFDPEKVLMQRVYDPLTGWRTNKRPGADDFLKKVMHSYELVAWTNDVYPTAQKICSEWGVPVVAAFHRGDCERVGGRWLRPLDRLGRDPNKTVVLAVDKEVPPHYQRNVILIKPFAGQPTDVELHMLGPFLASGSGWYHRYRDS